MTILTRIEAALKAIDQATFQELCDTYLHRRGYGTINVVGRVVGAQKTRKGRPDTFFLQPDGKYIFAEYTTQEQRLVAKLLADVLGCFDSDDTGLPPGSVKEVAICHNRQLEPKEVEFLQTACTKNGAILSLFGLNQIAQDLYNSYPGLARDFLGVQVDTGQIVSVDDFITAYQRSPLATPLTTQLRCRDAELTQLVRQIEENDIVLVTGAAGVGKTRLAIEACRTFAATHQRPVLRCIRNVHADLFEDLRVHLSPLGDYLVFVDDANRITRFEYICSFFSEARPGRRLKVVATVRDYALESVHTAARAAGATGLLKVEPLEDKHIIELVHEEFGIKNDLYQDRIVRIARGNPRLAVMAAKVAITTNTLESIADASSLYDEYFASIRSDLEQLNDPALLRAAFVVAFFRKLDRHNNEQMRIANEVFGICPSVLWEAVQTLHQAEIVDVYENEVARIADQVIATYLAYLGVFREKLVPLRTVLLSLFPTFRRQLLDLLAPVVNVFHSEDVDRVLRSEVEHAWQEFERAGNSDAVWELMDVFWFVRPAETLAEVGRQIDAREPTSIAPADIEFTTTSSSTHLSRILEILGHFRADRTLYPTAVELVLHYLEVSQAEAGAVYHFLTHALGITRHSHLQGFEAEHILLDKLWERTRGGDDEVFSLLYVAVAEPFLKTHFQQSESHNENTVTIYQLDPPATPEFLALRENLWKRLFILLQRSPLLRDRVVRLLQKHSQSGYEVGNEEIVARDSDNLLSLFRAHLDPTRFQECLVVHDYLDLLRRLKVDFDPAIAAAYSSDTLKLSELLLDDRYERSEIGWEAYEVERRERLEKVAAELKQGDFTRLFARCLEIRPVVRGGHREYQFLQNIRALLLAVGARDRELFEEAVSELIRIPAALGLDPYALVAKLLEGREPERVYEILQGADPALKTQWLLCYFSMPDTAVNMERVAEVCRLYEGAASNELIFGLGFLVKYLAVDPGIVAKVTEILLKKDESQVGHIFSGAFDHEKGFAERLTEIYANHVPLLKQAYLAAALADRHSDPHAATFNKILDLDPNFVSEWVRWFYWNHRWPSDHDDDRDYSILWQRPDYRVVLDAVIRAIAERHREQGFPGGYLSVFFQVPAGDGAVQVHQRQDAFLSEFIAANAHDGEMMEVVFSVISQFNLDRRRSQIVTFLAHNSDVQAFEALAIEPRSWGASGSFVPIVQGRIDFLESLIPMLSSAPLLQHRVSIEKRIADLKAEMAWEKKRDFLRG